MDNAEILKKAGLSDPQAEIYECLLKNGAMTPAELGEKTSQSRENCYAIIKKLVDLELVEQTKDKKTTYRVLNPSNLEVLAERRRKVAARNEKAVKDNISTLLDVFYANNELPGSRTVEGPEGLKDIYNDIISTKKDVFILRCVASRHFWHSKEEYHDFLTRHREQRAINGIHTYALTPVNPYSLKNAKNGKHAADNYHRAWSPTADYTAPVEIQVYGDKTALISFGETIMSTIITSPTVAEAMRQIIKSMIKLYEKTFPQDQK
jgi:sugar-specific transcriptional regulator TrmB